MPRLASALAIVLTFALATSMRAQGALIVLNKSDAQASIVDLSNARIVATLPVGDGPHEVAVSSDGRTAVVGNYGGKTPGSSLTVLDLAKRSVVRTIDLGQYRRPHGMVWLPDGKRVAVTVEMNRAVLLVDVARGVVERAVPTDAELTHMVVVSRDGSHAFTANIGGGSVSRLDLSGKTPALVRVTGKGPEAIDLSPDGKEVWAADRTLDRITIMGSDKLDSLGSAPTLRFPNRLKFTPDGKRVLVSNATAGAITVYDAARRTLIETIHIPFDASKKKAEAVLGDMGDSAVPLGIVMDPAGKRAWVATAALGEIVELDLETLKITRTIAAGSNPDGMAYLSRLP
ncbi:MAG: beta-propeller fold lactonase family protein [Gemmatimonadaceae bacterium]